MDEEDTASEFAIVPKLPSSFLLKKQRNNAFFDMWYKLSSKTKQFMSCLDANLSENEDCSISWKMRDDLTEFSQTSGHMKKYMKNKMRGGQGRVSWFVDCKGEMKGRPIGDKDLQRCGFLDPGTVGFVDGTDLHMNFFLMSFSPHPHFTGIITPTSKGRWHDPSMLMDHHQIKSHTILCKLGGSTEVQHEVAEKTCSGIKGPDLDCHGSLPRMRTRGPQLKNSISSSSSSSSSSSDECDELSEMEDEEADSDEGSSGSDEEFDASPRKRRCTRQLPTTTGSRAQGRPQSRPKTSRELQTDKIYRAWSKFHEASCPHYTSEERKRFGLKCGGVGGNLKARCVERLLFGNDGLQLTSEDVLFDAGSGRGVPASVAAANGSRVIGGEIEPLLVRESWLGFKLLADKGMSLAPTIFSQCDALQLRCLPEMVTKFYAFTGYTEIIGAMARAVALSCNVTRAAFIVTHSADLEDVGMIDENDNDFHSYTVQMSSGLSYVAFVMPITEMRRARVLSKMTAPVDGVEDLTADANKVLNMSAEEFASCLRSRASAILADHARSLRGRSSLSSGEM
jgi:hypothetical protein